MCRQMVKLWIKTMINILIIQVKFICTINISAIESMAISMTTIAKITNRNTGMH